MKKHWFDMIAGGKKREAYREIKPFWEKRLERFRGLYAPIVVCFRNGYHLDSPKLFCLVHISIGTGFEEWGAVPGKKYYLLKIEKIYERSDYE